MNNFATSLSMVLIFTLLFMVINANGINFGINIHASPVNNQEWQNAFDLESCDLASNGANSYFILEPGYQLILEGQEDGALIQLKISVLNETKIVNGMEARLAEEVESEDGEIVEISRNWFVVCRPSNDIFYLVEEVDIYEDGKIVNHEGA